MKTSSFEDLQKYKGMGVYYPKKSYSGPSYRRNWSPRRVRSPTRSYKRDSSRSPPREYPSGSKRHKPSHKKHSPLARHSDRDKPVVGYTSSHQGSHTIGSTAATMAQTTMAPLFHSSSQGSLVCPESPEYPHDEIHQLRTCGPANAKAFRDAVKFAQVTENWGTRLSHNFNAIAERYNYAKVRIGEDRARIERLENELKESKAAYEKLSESMTRQCELVTESEKKATDAEQKAKDMLEAQEALKLEKDRLITEHVQETLQLQNSLKEAGEELTKEKLKVTKLEAEKTRLTEENTELQTDLVDKKKLIDDTSEIIDSFIFNIWYHKDLTWADEYDDWMLKIMRRSMEEARDYATKEGQEFDEDAHLLENFTEEEREAINRAFRAEQGVESSSSHSDAFSTSKHASVADEEAETETKEVEEHGSPVLEFPSLDPLNVELKGKASLTSEPTKEVATESMQALVTAGLTEAPSNQTQMVSSVASVDDVGLVDPFTMDASIAQGSPIVINIEETTSQTSGDTPSKLISPFREPLITTEQDARIKQEQQEHIDKNKQDK